MEGGGYEITITVVIKFITIIIVIVTIISKPSSLKESVADEDVVRLRGLGAQQPVGDPKLPTQYCTQLYCYTQLNIVSNIIVLYNLLHCNIVTISNICLVVSSWRRLEPQQ